MTTVDSNATRGSTGDRSTRRRAVGGGGPILRAIDRAQFGAGFSAAALAMIIVLVGACTSVSSVGPAPASTTRSGSSGAISASTAAVPTGPTDSGAGNGTIPSNQCSVVTKADVEAAFGGSSTAGKIDENGHCVFEVSGAIHAGPNAGIPGTVSVDFIDRYTTFDDAKFLFGSEVSKVDGLGADAWYGLRAVHAKIAAGELVVGGFWVGNFDRSTIQKDTITLAKTILPRL